MDILIKLVLLFILEVKFSKLLILIMLLKFYLKAPEFLPNWDKQVQELCTQVNAVIEKIQTVEPEWSRNVLECQTSH